MFIASSSPIVLTNTDYLHYSIQYGITNKEVMNIWIPTIPSSPTGIIVYVHGGGFISGDVSNGYDSEFISELLDNGIAYASIDYDLLETDVESIGVISCLNSVKLAVQFLKYHSSFFNLDKNNFILKGSSAGAGASMWVSYQTDMQNPSSINDILKESTLVKSVILYNPQATYNLLRWEDEVFSDIPAYNAELDYNSNLETRKSTNRLFAINTYQELINISIYRDSVDMLKFIDEMNPVDTYMECNHTLHTTITSNTILDITHSPYHGRLIKQHLDNQLVENISYINELYTDPSGETELQFIIRKLN